MGPSKESTCKAGEVGSIPGLGRFRGEGNSYYSSILAWRIPWTETVGGLQSMGLQELDMTERLTFTFSLSRGQMDTIAKKNSHGCLGTNLLEFTGQKQTRVRKQPFSNYGPMQECSQGKHPCAKSEEKEGREEVLSKLVFTMYFPSTGCCVKPL